MGEDIVLYTYFFNEKWKLLQMKKLILSTWFLGLVFFNAMWCQQFVRRRKTRGKKEMELKGNDMIGNK